VYSSQLHARIRGSVQRQTQIHRWRGHPNPSRRAPRRTSAPSKVIRWPLPVGRFFASPPRSVLSPGAPGLVYDVRCGAGQGTGVRGSGSGRVIHFPACSEIGRPRALRDASRSPRNGFPRNSSVAVATCGAISTASSTVRSRSGTRTIDHSPRNSSRCASVGLGLRTASAPSRRSSGPLAASLSRAAPAFTWP
jgi:hypothetical protein